MIEITEYNTTLDHLQQKYQSLQGQIATLKKQIQVRNSDSYLENRLREQQERDERDWEAQMEAGQKALNQMEQQLEQVKEETEILEKKLHFQRLGNGIPKQEALQAESTSLKEILHLRAEEKRDMVAALNSVRNKRETMNLRDAAHSPTNEFKASADLASEEIATLKRKRDELKATIVNTPENYSSHTGNFKNEIDTKRSKLKRVQLELKQQREVAEEIRKNIRKAITSKIAHKSNGGNTEAAYILDMLLENQGEMVMNDLKSKFFEEFGTTANPVRVVYSLVANGLIQISQSYADGIVTCLLI